MNDSALELLGFNKYITHLMHFMLSWLNFFTKEFVASGFNQTNTNKPVVDREITLPAMNSNQQLIK